jgi:hypothetical protein
MSVKAVKQYYDQICDQYHEMLENIHDLEVEAAQGMVEPERIERLKEQVAPIKQNYERWSYMMFLLNQPERKMKVPRYKSQNRKFLKSLSSENSLEAVLDENREALKHIGE